MLQFLARGLRFLKYWPKFWSVSFLHVPSSWRAKNSFGGLINNFFSFSITSAVEEQSSTIVGSRWKVIMEKIRFFQIFCCEFKREPVKYAKPVAPYVWEVSWILICVQYIGSKMPFYFANRCILSKLSYAWLRRGHLAGALFNILRSSMSWRAIETGMGNFRLSKHKRNLNMTATKGVWRNPTCVTGAYQNWFSVSLLLNVLSVR